MAQTSESKSQIKRAAKRGEYIVTIVINIVMIVVFNNLRSWGVSFLTEGFDSLLWIFNLASGAMIAANAIYLAYDPRWFTAATKFFINIISLTWMLRLYQAFPFDFGDAAFPVLDFGWDTIAKLVLILAMIGTGIAILVEFLRWVGAMMGIGRFRS